MKVAIKLMDNSDWSIDSIIIIDPEKNNMSYNNLVMAIQDSIDEVKGNNPDNYTLDDVLDELHSNFDFEVYECRDMDSVEY